MMYQCNFLRTSYDITKFAWPPTSIRSAGSSSKIHTTGQRTTPASETKPVSLKQERRPTAAVYFDFEHTARR